ncbi:nitrate reductase catalytic subunit [Desulfolithobacter dissulfuricans]|uniref:Nitrate reductase n=1 Tax=Desulfolithobacter dissulfuricans TaxID=2795293 RepID=A0A915XIW2_9BACT|nr:nitrate reductase [Desulfolithobacter dissulfuricans]BCO09610.1 nitrate reductase catalytic subunit [Desulfolithobacter dissulfuricans]
MAQTRRDFLKKTAALSAASYVGMNLPLDKNSVARAEEGIRWHRGSCRLCGVGCRVELGVKNGQPVGLRGVPQARTNFGYVCMKGMHFWKCMRHADRLTRPLYREKKTGTFREISWDKALDIAASKFAEAVTAHGNDSVAYYGSGQALTEETYLFQKVMRGGLQTNNVEGNPRLCMASAVGGYLTSFGADEPIGGYDDLEKAYCFFIIGSNTAEAHPVLFRRIMRRKLDNPEVKVINADPRLSQTSRIADKHLQFKPGTDLALLNAMAYVIIEEKLYDQSFFSTYATFRKGKEKKEVSFDEYKKFVADYPPEKAARIMGGKVTADDIREVARWFATSKGTVSLWTMGINQRKRGVWANNLIHNLHILTGQLLKPGADSLSLTGQPNACGGVREGGGLCHILPGHRLVKKEKLRNQVEEAWGIPKGRIPPKPGYHTMAMFSAVNAGKIKAIWINCTSPAQSLPNCNLYNKGLAREDVFIVCSDIFPTRTTEYANLILPTAFHFEKTGVYGCTERRSQLTRKAIDPPGDAKPEVWIVREWAKKLASKLNDPVIAQCVKPFDGLEEGYELPRAIWNEYTQKLTKGRDNDLQGATYEVLEQMYDGVQWPAPTRAHALKGGTVKKFVRGMDPMADSEATSDLPYQFYGPAHKDRKLWVWLRPQADPEEMPDAEYPFYLSTGRIIDHWHTMSMTGRVPELLRANPYAYVEINPNDAKKLGIKPGDMVEVRSRRGVNVLPAKVYEGPIEGMVFVYWHDQHPERMINKVTKDAIDPGSKEPEFKICAVKVKRVSGPVPLKPLIV